jgi:hypothetical protein
MSKRPMKTNEPQTEIILSPAMQQQTEIDRSTIQSLVAKQVAEILAKRDEAVFEPFFRSRQVAFELRRLQSVPEQQKWSTYFSLFGCIDCKQTDKGHAACGFCFRCYGRVGSRLRKIVTGKMKGDRA